MKDERNYGIDALRMLSMLMVVILHVLGCGGVLSETVPQSVAYFFAWTMEHAAFCAVNCYALISGYVMYNRRGSVGKLLSLWLSVVFWSVLCSIVVWTMYPDSFLSYDIFKAIFPITNYQYWYISAYFLLYLLMPILQAALVHLSRSTLTAVVAGTFLLASVGTALSGVDAFASVWGYSPIWLCLCFLWGGYLRKYDVVARVKAWWGAGMYVAGVGATTMYKVIVEQSTEGEMSGDSLLLYTSPFMVLAAVGLLAVFVKMPACTAVKRAIGFLSPAALGVYLIHTHSLVFANVVQGFAVSFAALSVPLMPFAVLGAAVGIYLVCTVLELARIYLFRLAGVPRLCRWLDGRIAAWIARHEKPESNPAEQ